MAAHRSAEGFLDIAHGNAKARELAAIGRRPAALGGKFTLELGHLLLGLADPGDLGAGVDHPRDGVEVDVARAARDALRDRPGPALNWNGTRPEKARRPGSSPGPGGPAAATRSPAAARAPA